MIVNISEPAADAALDAIGAMMNAGSIELLTGDGDVLATLKLSDPAAEAAVDGELHFNAIGEGIATARGVAETGRVVAATARRSFPVTSVTRTWTR